ncbi:GAS2-like protein pickled eggs [Planococcus citri]|uniref:GAS2-like protein pickled eggs n=1 Tax=Planococcus citri TaxID=170843 RepID=UPI0031F7F586
MAVMVEQRSFRPFKSSEEYLYAMKEDLAEWLNILYPDLYINVNNFMDRLDTGVALCKHANNVRKYAEEYVDRRQAAGKTNVHSIATSCLRLQPVRFLPGAKAGTFFARDNVSNFITWCRHGLGVYECLLFETDDLIMRKNEKHVILCLLEVARRAAKLGMPAPMLVHLEREIDREIAAEKRKLRFGGCQDYYEQVSDEESDLSDGDDCVEYGPIPQIVTNDLKSLDEMVRDEVEKCQCPTQFPMIRVSEGKYRIGDTKVLIFVRILRSHVMVRVGGGWDTLSHYLDKHDPCRCRTAHRAAVSSRITGVKSGGPALEISHAQVHYDRSPPRTRRSSTSSNSSGGGGGISYLPSAATLTAMHARQNQRCRSPMNTLAPNVPSERRSRSPTPRKKMSNLAPEKPHKLGRSRSPTPTPKRSRSRTPKPAAKQSSTTKEKERSCSYIASNKDLTLHVDEDGCVVSRSRSPSVGKRSRNSSRSSRRLSSGVDDEETPSRRGQQTECASGVDYSPTNRVSDNFVGTNQYRLLNTNAPSNEQTSTRRSPSPCLQRSGIDTTPACKVAENFVGTNQYDLLNANSIVTSAAAADHQNSKTGQQHKNQHSGRSGVDTTPVSKVSDNFCASGGTASRSSRSSASVNDLDLITKKESNDSGSEVSDEGYKSLGLVSTPPATSHHTTVPPLTGSPSRVVRPPRSRSAGGQDSPSPQQSPFRRNSKANQSARQSPTHQANATAKPICHSSRNYNTWNSSGHAGGGGGDGSGRKKRAAISEDTFCQQVAEIMQQYAAMMPSPRKDSKPDSRISTRIPAPVPIQKT